jgi:hypothetical protein
MEQQMLRCFADSAKKSSTEAGGKRSAHDDYASKIKPQYVPISVPHGGKHQLMEEPIYLENPWSFWFDKYAGPGLTVEQYAASLKKLGTVNTIQVFDSVNAP